MASAVAALWRATVKAAAAGTLKGTILDGIALATWALQHPDLFGAAVDLIRGATGGAWSGAVAGGSAAVESPAMENAGRPGLRGGR